MKGITDTNIPQKAPKANLPSSKETMDVKIYRLIRIASYNYRIMYELA